MTLLRPRRASSSPTGRRVPTAEFLRWTRTWLVVAATLGLFALSLAQPDTRITVVVVGLIALVAIVVISRAPMATIGVALIVAFAFAASWDQVTVGGVRPRLILLVLGLLFLVLGYGVLRPPPIPWWIHTYAAGVVFVTALQYVFPISDVYLNARYLTSQAGQSLLTRPGTIPSLLSALFNAYAVPVGVVLAVAYKPKSLRWIVNAYVAGAAISNLAAYLGFEGNPILLTPLVPVVPPPGTRALGYTSHPLHLATSAVFAIGLACWMAVQKRVITKWTGRIALVCLFLGVYASGSRGGSGALVLAVALCAFLLPNVRQNIHNVMAAGGLVIAAVISFVPSVGLEILRTMRIYHGATNAVSDTGRNEVLHQGLQDWNHSPIFGIGVRYISEAHVLYAGVLASGGVILFAAYLAFNWGSIRDAIRGIAVDRMLGGALLATLVASLAYWLVADEFGIASVGIVYGCVIALLIQVQNRELAPRDVLEGAGLRLWRLRRTVEERAASGSTGRAGLVGTDRR